MRKFALIIQLLALFGLALKGQTADPLNTAADASFMKENEKAMIREINLLRSDPKGYLVYVDQYVAAMDKKPETIGKGQMKYSLTFNYKMEDSVEKLVRIDTVWLDAPESDATAIENLRNDLLSAPPVPLLQPDIGIYEAARAYAKDEDDHKWTLRHVGSDGSWPWDRIRRYSPGMAEGNENIASRYPEPTPRQIVIQLLIDTGIPEHNHRYILLDPRWTHIACYDASLKEGMYRWIQEFGQEKGR